jgi:CRISPR/Cas system-associated exonuclease Cas4 (RecB family)
MTDSLVTLSASKLKTFSNCPRKYWYDYVERVETKKHPAAVLGTAVHKTIERGYKEETPPLIIYGQEYNAESKRQEMPVVGKIFQDGIEMVARYDFTARTPQELELEFRLPFPNAAHPLCMIHGYMDQLYDWGFVDLKTNKRKPLRGVLDNDLQFIVYTWGFKELTGYDPEASVWHHLRTGEDLIADTAGEDKVDLAQRVIERILESQMTGIYDKNVGDPCLFCPHKEPCLGRSD